MEKLGTKELISAVKLTHDGHVGVCCWREQHPFSRIHNAFLLHTYMSNTPASQQNEGKSRANTDVKRNIIQVRKSKGKKPPLIKRLVIHTLNMLDKYLCIKIVDFFLIFLPLTYNPHFFLDEKEVVFMAFLIFFIIIRRAEKLWFCYQNGVALPMNWKSVWWVLEHFIKSAFIPV